MFNFLFNKSGLEVEVKEDFDLNSIGGFLINLDRSLDRLEFVKPTIDKLDFPVQRVSAVDGKFLSEEEIQNIVDQERFKGYFNMIPERGTIGCSLSHEKVWREFLKSKYEFAIVFEDDITFDADQLRKCLENLIENKHLWDIVSFEMNHNGWPLKVASLYEDKNLCVYLASVKHSGCYVINRNAAKKLLEKFFPIVMPLDHYFTASWEFDIKFMGVEPRIVKQKFGESVIKSEHSRRFNETELKVKRAMFDIRRAIVGFCYNLYVYLVDR